MNDYRDRMVVDGLDRDLWLAAREGKIGGSDAASFSKIESAPLYIRAKLHNPFTGNAYTAHGNDRERAMLRAFNLEQNRALYHAEDNPLHVCTPDAIKDTATGGIILAQAKTSGKPLPSKIPLGYLRQMWWEQYVMGTDRTLLVWEHHEGFAPLEMEPVSVIVYRDDAEISKLVTIADLVLEGMASAAQFRKEISQ